MMIALATGHNRLLYPKILIRTLVDIPRKTPIQTRVRRQRRLCRGAQGRGERCSRYVIQVRGVA